jgi:hypothetical protein
MSDATPEVPTDLEQPARAYVDRLRPGVSLFVRPTARGAEAPAPDDATVAQVSAARFTHLGIPCEVEPGADGVGWKVAVDVPEGHPWLLLGTTLAERAGFAAAYRTVRPLWHDDDYCRTGTEKFATLAGAVTAAAVVANKAMQALRESPIGVLLYEHFGRPITAAMMMAEVRSRLQKSGVWTTRLLDAMEPDGVVDGVVHSPLLIVDAIADIHPAAFRGTAARYSGVFSDRRGGLGRDPDDAELPYSADGDEGAFVDGLRRIFPRIDAAAHDAAMQERPSLADLPYAPSLPGSTTVGPFILHHEPRIGDQHVAASVVKARRPSAIDTIDAHLRAILDAPHAGGRSTTEAVVACGVLCDVLAEASGWPLQAWRERTAGMFGGSEPPSIEDWRRVSPVLRAIADLARRPQAEG